jgi:hypothetical protein
MKKLLLALTCLGLAQAHATLYTYSYNGDPYTSSTNPNLPGVRLIDRLTSSFIIDDSLWGTEAHNAFLAPLRSGPYEDAYATRILFDATGQILSWGISGDGAGFDSLTRGLLDGSGLDFFAGVRMTNGEHYDAASVTYPVGSPSRWVIRPVLQSVPDSGSSALLLAGAAGLLFFFRPRKEKAWTN